MRAALFLAVVFFALPLLIGTGPAANAAQVVHSRRGPVILHRALPPFRGQHVYGGRR